MTVCTSLPNKSEYLSAYPYPHCVIDGYFDSRLLESVLKEWPDMSVKKVGKTSVKNIESDPRRMGWATIELLGGLMSAEFVDSLSRLTGIEGLFADPYMVGGGLHETPAGGFLRHHIDFNWNERIQAVRKVNLLLYLNDTKNGDLELLKDGVVEKRIPTKFNRMVIFNTDENSWHGHPEPLVGAARKSVALYYYREEPKPSVRHSTIYG